jgi:hypothetical protein
MKYIGRQIAALVCVSLMICFLSACGKPKEGKVTVSEQEFSIRQDGKQSWTLDAKGKVKNVGEVDVKNVVVTGYCKSCGEIIVNGAWFISDLDKTPEQKDTIGYLPVGAEEEFNFKGVAYMMEQSGTAPDKMPDQFECKVVSFESVNK